MSTPNPVLVAAAPTLIIALQELQTAINTIVTGDPLQAPARVEPAVAIFLAQLQLLLPGLAGAELTAANVAVGAKITGLIAQLKALAPAA
jgi:hypothetical protein